jgi:hypothetical protein
LGRGWSGTRGRLPATPFCVLLRRERGVASPCGVNLVEEAGGVHTGARALAPSFRRPGRHIWHERRSVVVVVLRRWILMGRHEEILLNGSSLN